MKTLTIDDVMAYEPCYRRERVEELFAGRTEMTIREICVVDVSAKDRVWLLTHDGVLDADMRDKWITMIVTRAITNHALHCGIPEVEHWAREWLSGADRSSESAHAARRDAYAAHAYAARHAADAAHASDASYIASAARYAAYIASAARYAADAAANAAAYAAYVVAYAAAYATCAAYVTEGEQQIADLLSLLPE